MNETTALIAAITGLIAAAAGYLVKVLENRATMAKLKLQADADAIAAYDQLCQRLNARLEAMQLRLTEAEQRMSDYQTKLDGANDRIQELENQNGALQREIAQLRTLLPQGQAMEVK